MAQITRITSEALQATIRRLLPSQQGFGEDLQATNVITPIIDLTPTAEGSSVRQDLQTASSFTDTGGWTTSPNATTSNIITTPGFWQVRGGIVHGNKGSIGNANVSVNDGSSTNAVVSFRYPDNASGSGTFTFEFVLFLVAGESLQATADSESSVFGNYRQIADVNGVLNNPTGFTPQ